MKPAILRFFAIILLFFGFLVAYNLSHIAPVFATASPAPCTATAAGDQYAKDSIDEINKCAIKSNIFDDKIFNLNQIAGTTDSLLTVLLGYSQLHPETNELTAGTGALAASGRMVASLYAVPPVSGVNYLAEKFQKFNPVQPAYAATGIGFDTLKPVEKVWTAFRNMSYVAFTLVFVVIGFMIMFRSKISPQAVATVQDSLPRIVVALILVTFSYAIAGLMIDIMFLLLNVVINLLDGAGLITKAKADFVFKQSIFGVGFSIFDDVFKTVFSSVLSIVEDLVKINVLNKVLGFFGGGLAGIVAGVALFYVMFRVFFMLLMAYVSIILLTIFAPFILLFQALPGNNGAKEWFKQVAANISVFPTVALMLILAGVLSGVSQLGGNGTNSEFTSGQIGQFPLLSSGLDPRDIGKLIAIGFVFMTPAAAKLVKDRFGVKEGAMGAGMGAAMGALGAGAGVGAGVGKYAWGGEHSPLGRWNKTRAGVRQESIQQNVEQQAVDKGIKMRDPNTNIATYKPK